MNSKCLNKLIFVNITIIIVFIATSFIISNHLYHTFIQRTINNNAYIINSIIKNNPELEDEIITNLLSDNKETKEGLEIFRKYGLDKQYNLKFFKENIALEKKITHNIVILTSIIIISFITIYYFYFKYNSHKIKGINKYMYNVLNGDYSFDIREYDEGEISTLKNDIYKITTILKEQNEKSFEDKKYLESVLSDISHQLKTPLTSMYVINDLLSKDDIDVKVKKEFLNKNRKQLERIEWLVTSLLKMSRLESGTVLLKPQKVNLTKLINDALEPLKIPIEIKKQNIEMNIKDDIEINVDFNWTLEALVNIIKNACEHTMELGTIKIEANDNPIYTEINIIDNGEGISKEDLPHIFERFYKSKTSSSESIGIGLNMTKKIINKQNGDIKVISELGQGTTFNIKLYKMVI